MTRAFVLPLLLVSAAALGACASDTPSASHGAGTPAAKSPCGACTAGKAGESVWCAECGHGFVGGKKVACAGCYAAKTGGPACPSCAAK